MNNNESSSCDGEDRHLCFNVSKTDCKDEVSCNSNRARKNFKIFCSILLHGSVCFHTSKILKLLAIVISSSSWYLLIMADNFLCLSKSSISRCESMFERVTNDNLWCI